MDRTRDARMAISVYIIQRAWVTLRKSYSTFVPIDLALIDLCLLAVV